MSEKKITLRELVENIDFKLTHLEDIEADNRELIIKLIKQGNTIVEFLKQFDIEDDVDSFEMGLPELPDISEKTSTTKVISLKDLLDEFTTGMTITGMANKLGVNRTEVVDKIKIMLGNKTVVTMGKESNEKKYGLVTLQYEK